LEAEWTEIKKCEPGKVQVRTLKILGSSYTDDMRKVFPLQWPIRVLRRGPKGNECKINYQKLLNLYPNFNDANQKFYTKFVNPESSKKKKKRLKSRAEQRQIYQELLNSGKVKNQAEIARKFDVSRAWVSKVLS
jgi:hypothetical protein